MTKFIKNKKTGLLENIQGFAENNQDEPKSEEPNQSTKKRIQQTQQIQNLVTKTQIKYKTCVQKRKQIQKPGLITHPMNPETNPKNFPKK